MPAGYAPSFGPGRNTFFPYEQKKICAAEVLVQAPQPAGNSQVHGAVFCRAVEKRQAILLVGRACIQQNNLTLSKVDRSVSSSNNSDITYKGTRRF